MNDLFTQRDYTKKEWIGLSLLLILFFLLALLTYNHLGEDGFISFRYSRNLARGLGFVYNRGEYVEGYSNLLWVLLIAPFELIGVRAHLAARIISTLFFAGLIVGGWWTARRLVRSDYPAWLIWWLPVAIALEPYLHYHDDRGLETVAYAALLGLMMFTAVGKAPFWIAGTFAGFAVITRPEGIGFVVAIAPAVYTQGLKLRDLRKYNSERFNAVLRFAAIPIAIFLLQLIFRKLYHGGWVPNTMVAKKPSGGGLNEVIALTASHAFVPLIGLLGLLLGLIKQHTRPLSLAGIGMMAAAVVFQLQAGGLMNVAFRYLAPILIPSVVGIWLLVVTGAEALRLDRSSGESHRFLQIVAVCLLFLVPVTIFVPGSRVFRGNGDAPESRILSRLVQKETYQTGERIDWFLSDPIFLNAEAGRWVRENLESEALLAADQMGQFGYYAGPDQSIIDLLGLMDAEIAQNGLSIDYLKRRRPAYLVVETCLDSDFWPRDWRLQPHVTQLRAMALTPEFQSLYRPRWLLRSKVDFMEIGFMVYIRKDLDDGEALEKIDVGIDEETFRQKWRIGLDDD